MSVYNISMKKNLFFKYSNNIVSSCVQLKDGQVFFKTDDVTLKYLDNNKITYKLIDSNIKKMKRRLFNNLTLILSVFIALGILYINSFRVSNISFNGSYLINDKIEDTIKSKYKHYMFWDFISCDLKELSSNIRQTYTDYEWISITKEGSTIYVTINDNDKTSSNINCGNIVSKCDAIITSYEIYCGKCNIELNQYVKKGDVLISGNYENTLVEPRGVIYGTIYEEKTISILKEEDDVVETGNSKEYNLISLFNFNFAINKKSSYQSYKTEKKLKFNLFNFFEIYEIKQIEIKDIVNKHNYKDAYNLAYNEIIDNFNLNKHFDKEKIINMQLLRHDEDDLSYTFKFLIKKDESIGIFKSC